MITFRQSLTCLLFLGYSALQAQIVSIKETPDWVVPVKIPKDSKINKYDVNNGVYSTLYDIQANLDKQSEYIHSALNVLTYGGVKNASELYLTYDSSYQKLNFHYLYIWRKGVKLDKTADLSFELLNNEDNLNAGIYSGKVTAYDILEDIRKDDIIEYAYTIIGNNPIFEDYKYTMTSLNGENPIDKIHVRIINSKEEDFELNCYKCDNYKVEEKTNGNYIEKTITGENIEKVKAEESASPNIIQYGFVNVSTYKDWAEVEKWASRVFTLEEKPDFKEVSAEIFTSSMSKEAKIDAIINFVQDEIRYMGIESGIGSHKPFSPNQVLKQRFGDCKDKALLAAELLKSIGVEKAYPVLVNTYFTKGLKLFQPSGNLFDHCILHFEYEGELYWVDLTIPQQGGNFKTMVCPNYGECIVVGKKAYNLIDMNIKDMVSRAEVKEVLDVSSFTENGTMTVTSTYYGAKADYFRSALEYYSLDEFSDSYRETYAKLYPKINVLKDLKVEDDVENNILVSIETYSIENPWTIEVEGIYEKKNFQYEPLVMYNYVTNLDCEKKEFTTAIPFPSRVKLEVVIKYPEVISHTDEFDKYENKAFKYSVNTSLLGEKSIGINYDFQTLEEEVSPSEYEQVCSDMNKLVEDLPFQIFFSKIKENKALTSANRKFKKRDKKDFEKLLKDLKKSMDEEKQSNSSNEDDVIYTVVDQMPEFPGGEDSLTSYITSSLNYPDYEKKKKIEGTVYASYIINTEGKVENVRILRTVKGSKNFDAEVIRVLTAMPTWKPGSQKGEPVNVQYTIPFKFALN